MRQTDPKTFLLVLIFLPSAEEDGHDEYDGDHPLQYQLSDYNQRPVFRSRDQ